MDNHLSIRVQNLPLYAKFHAQVLKLKLIKWIKSTKFYNEVRKKKAVKETEVGESFLEEMAADLGLIDG